MNALKQKIKDVVFAVLPITAILLILNYTIAPIGRELVWRFVVGAVFIILGLGIFLFGTDLSIQPIGQNMGSSITKKKSLILLTVSGIALGFLVNIAEPDLMVLAKQVHRVTEGTFSQWALLIVVSIGIGLMIAIGLLRIVFKVPMNRLMTALYIMIFVLAVFSPDTFLGIAFDSGAATTGSMTVPFILALGLGVASTQGGKQSEEDSFGLLGIASAGPMLAVLTMGIFSRIEALTSNASNAMAPSYGIIRPFIVTLPKTIGEVTLAMVPLVMIFIIFQLTLLKLTRPQLIKITKGLIYTFSGFVLFLTGVNAGFMEAGTAVGYAVAVYGREWVTVLVGFTLGFTVIFAEPAVYVLNGQVEEVTSGYIKKKNILYALSIGVAVAVALSMARILIPALKLWHLLLPGYIIAITLSYFAPNLFVGIAFDSGGVASGPMAATFILAFAQGVAEATPGADVLMEGFGVIGMVALTPLIAIQTLGLIYKYKASKRS